MSNPDGVLVDTSVWIEYFNHPDSPHGHEASNLIDNDSAFIAGIVIAKLIQGTRNEREEAQLREALNALPYLEDDRPTWKKAGSLAYNLRRNGNTVPITDCLLSALSIHHELPIYSLDEDFELFENVERYEPGQGSSN